ncbi:protein kinase, partial [bacterium]|nr:protein kinase [bacterium]
MKCPKCQTDNPDTLKFCGECGTQLIPTEEISAPTETLEAAKEELTTGSTFAGRYKIIEELGKGGMGKVYKVLDTKIKEKVALKLLKPEIASDKKTIERFSNELKFARKVRHENVCQMYDLGEEKGTHFITMEFVPGEDLKSMIRMSRQLSMGATIGITKQVCEGLASAHKMGVVHRDLKPQNIMIDKEGNARIMDFGIARSIEGKGITGAGVMIGTPEYMSPEQVEGKEVDQRSDIYSLGVILYEMVTGRVPFEGDTPFTIGVKQKSEEPRNPTELNSQIPEDLSRVILRCMEKNKENRYQSAGEVRSEIENIEKGIPTTEIEIPKRKPITSREITVTFGLKKLFIPALVVIALIIAAILIWQLLPQKEAVLAPKIENSIAVISFENQTGDKTYDYLQKAIPNLLITSLEQTGELYVVTWERMHDLIKQFGKKDVETIDRDLGFKLCRREGVESIVLGSFIKAGDMFAMDVKVLDVETKRLLKSASSKGEGVDSILKRQIDELSKEVSDGIGIARQRIEPTKMQVADVTTTSMDAYKHFINGRESVRKFYYEDALESLEKAVELDPNFASAYLFLAYSLGWLGNTKARNEAIEKAKSLSQKATDRERLWIEAAYARIIERNREKRFSILQKIAKKYPKEKQAYYVLGILNREYGYFDEAVEAFNKALELDPDYGEAHNDFGYTYLDMGNFEKSIDHFKKYASLNPGDANPFDSMAEAYFLMGRLDEAISKYKEALEVKPDFSGTPMKIGYIYALKEDYPEALKWVDKDISLATSPGYKRTGYLWRGFYHHWLGRLEQSLIDIQKAIDLAESVGSETGKAYVEWL